MASALDPVMRATGGLWIAHGSGDADRAVVDERDHVRVPPKNSKFSLRRIWLTPEQVDGHYNGLSNQGLWPLCHVAFTRPYFEPRHWELYREVNQIFADAVLKEAGDEPTFVFIQDYHFALLPRMLQKANANLVIAQFWHIPWPNREVFRSFPWQNEILDGLLGNDLLGFHLHQHCQNFLETVDRSVEALCDPSTMSIKKEGKQTLVRAFPISVDYDAHVQEATSREVRNEMDAWRKRLNLTDMQLLAVGVDLWTTPREFQTGYAPSTGFLKSIPSSGDDSCSPRSEFPAGPHSMPIVKSKMRSLLSQSGSMQDGVRLAGVL